MLSARYRPGSGDKANDLILFIHGLGCDKHSFDEAWENKALQNYAMLAADFPGCGDSPIAKNQQPTMPFYADSLFELLGDYNFDRLHIVAHSMGAAPGLLMTEKSGLPLASFVNVEGNLVSEDAGMLSRRTAETTLEKFKSVNYQKLISGAERSDDAGVLKWAEQLRNCPAEIYHAKSISLVEWSDNGRLIDIFSTLSVPKLYVYGDRSVNPDVLAQLQHIPQQELKDCGHFIMSEKPDIFYPLLAEFLGKIH